jgi:hypothetical protein
MWFAVPIVDWGVGVATTTIPVSTTLAWGLVLGALALACASLWFLTESEKVERKPASKHELYELRRAA